MKTEQQSNLAYFLVVFNASDVSQVDFFFCHWHLKFQITEAEFLNPYIFYESRKSLDLSNFFTCNGCE